MKAVQEYADNWQRKTVEENTEQERKIGWGTSTPSQLGMCQKNTLCTRKRPEYKGNQVKAKEGSEFEQ